MMFNETKQLNNLFLRAFLIFAKCGKGNSEKRIFAVPLPHFTGPEDSV